MKRRNVLLGLGALAAGSIFCGAVMSEEKKAQYPFKTLAPARALVLYFSQTGHTAIYGELAAAALYERGMETRSFD